MSSLAEAADAQAQLLGLRSYYLQEYQAALASIGDVTTREPEYWRESFAHPCKYYFFTVLCRITDPLLYVLSVFEVIRAAPTSSFEAAAMLSDLQALKDSTARVSNSIFEVLHSLTDCYKILDPIEHFYAIHEIRPLLRLHKTPVPYAFAGIVSDSRESASYADPKHSVYADDSAVHNGRSLDVTDLKTPGSPRRGMKIKFQHVSFTYPK